MLSQRIAKAYLFMSKDVRASKARAQLNKSLAMFVKQNDEFKAKIKDKELNELFTFIEIILTDYAKLVNRRYSNKTGKEVLILSDTLLEVYHNVEVKLKNASKQKNMAQLVALSGHELMLSQRIAKQYIAYQAGFQDTNSVDQLNSAIIEFDTTLKRLMDSTQNTPPITSALAKVENLWGVLRRLLNLEQAGLPVTVFAITDKIMEEMAAITQMYQMGLAEK